MRPKDSLLLRPEGNKSHNNISHNDMSIFVTKAESEG